MDLVDDYLAAIEAADLAGVLRLFTEDGVVESPLYGTLPAVEFYPALFRDTASSRLTHRATMTGAGASGDVVSFWFDFDWTLADGTPTPFTVVDVAELDEDGRIARLHIIYDTAPLRGDFDRVTES